MAQQVYDLGEESKFEKLREILQDTRYKDEKIIIFTEHRDTLAFLARRLEGLGFTGKIAQLHGGMDYQEREEQVEFFRQPASAGGASYLLATDAAGEGINLQFCWLMVNYDIPWNPARLEQRMGPSTATTRDTIQSSFLILSLAKPARVVCLKHC